VPQHGESRLAVERARLVASAALSSISLSRLRMSQIVGSIALDGGTACACLVLHPYQVRDARWSTMDSMDMRLGMNWVRTGHLMPISDDLRHIFPR
jgi:hypothetical protein